MSINEKSLIVISDLIIFAVNNTGKDELFIDVKAGGVNNALYVSVWYGYWHNAKSRQVFSMVISLADKDANDEVSDLGASVLADGFLEGLLNE